MHNAAGSAREADDDRRCTEFTTDGVDTTEDSDVFGAAICPNCEKHNALTGTPADFREQEMRCMGCTVVMILDGTALVAFETEVAADAA
jgi:hypothetical protein